MYQVRTKSIYVTEWAAADKRCMARMKRMLPFIQHEEFQVVSEGELIELSTTHPDFVRSGKFGLTRHVEDPLILLNAFRWDKAEELERHKSNRLIMVMGGRYVNLRNAEKIRSEEGVICQTGLEIHSAYGCLHKCAYCPIGSVFNIMLNLEEFSDRVAELLDENPWQKIWKYDNLTDQICLEPEYGASELMVKLFAGRADQYLLLYTKSDNVEHLLDLEHGGKTVISWTLSPDLMCREMEHKTPGMMERILAAQTCQEAGYIVRFRFSPVIPVRNWRSEYRRMLEVIFARVKPNLISLWMLAMVNFEEFREIFPPELIDPDAWRAADQSSATMMGMKNAPFPHDIREEVYQFIGDEIRRMSPGTRFTICLETPEMWEVFGHQIGMRPNAYVCNCGGPCGPKHALLREHKAVS